MTDTTADSNCCCQSRGPAGASITIPGICNNLPMTALADDHEWLRATPAGQVHDGDLIFGDNRACGPMRIHGETPAELRALAFKANRLADWLEAVS